MKRIGGMLYASAAITIFSCLVFAETLTPAAAQPQQTTNCMHELRFCLPYLNNNDSDDNGPPDEERCCQPLEYVFRSIPECVCNLVSLLGMESTGINISQALTLPDRCGRRISSPTNCDLGAPDAATWSKNKAQGFGISYKPWDAVASVIAALALSFSIFLLL